MKGASECFKAPRGPDPLCWHTTACSPAAPHASARSVRAAVVLSSLQSPPSRHPHINPVASINPRLPRPWVSPVCHAGRAPGQGCSGAPCVGVRGSGRAHPAPCCCPLCVAREDEAPEEPSGQAVTRVGDVGGPDVTVQPTRQPFPGKSCGESLLSSRFPCHGVGSCRPTMLTLFPWGRVAPGQHQDSPGVARPGPMGTHPSPHPCSGLGTPCSGPEGQSHLSPVVGHSSWPCSFPFAPRRFPWLKAEKNYENQALRPQLTHHHPAETLVSRLRNRAPFPHTTPSPQTPLGDTKNSLNPPKNPNPNPCRPS